MALCRDRVVNYMQGVGYNLVRYPRRDILPLSVIGQGPSGTDVLGVISRLLARPRPKLPPAPTREAASEINGRSSDKIGIDVGLNLLAGVIGALGGNVGVKAMYQPAKSVQFHFSDVSARRLPPLQVGDLLKKRTFDTTNPVLMPYLERTGQFNLFIITEILSSRRFTVSATRGGGVGLELDVPVIANAVGANIKVSAEVSRSSTISFLGDEDHELVFAFRCYSVKLGYPNPTLELASPNDVVLDDEHRTSRIAPYVIRRDELLELGGPLAD